MAIVRHHRFPKQPTSRQGGQIGPRARQPALETSGVTFIACANTRANMSKQENKPVPLVGEAKLVPSGVVRIMELKQKGYAYLRP